MLSDLLISGYNCRKGNLHYMMICMTASVKQIKVSTR
jgi:hypothetical protein